MPELSLVTNARTRLTRRFPALSLRAFASLAAFSLTTTQFASAQIEAKRWKIHDLQRPSPTVVTPASTVGAPPSDAVILFDGKNVSQWESTEGGDAKWTVKDGYMETSPGSGAIKTRKGFGDMQLHVEWASPSQVQGNGQGRGNSGVIIMGKYEVQVLDSYGNRTYTDGSASSVYGQYAPLVNASRPPGEWQTYDIIFRRPRFAADGKLVTPVNITVFHNGVLTQDHVDAWGETNWLQFTKYAKHADALPLVLQDHANPVKYRNIWLRELPDVPPPAHGPAESVAKVKVPLSLLQQYAGTYDGEAGGADVLLTNGVLQLRLAGSERRLDLMPQTQEKFDMRYTAGTVEFTRRAGAPTELHMVVAEQDRILKKKAK